VISTAQALDLYLHAYARGFDWQRAHCGDFAGGWVQAITGRNPCAGLPRQTSARAWARAVQQAGGMEALVSSLMQCAPIRPQQAQLGDVVMLPGSITGGTLGICAGRTGVFVTETGSSLHAPMTEAVLAWRLQPEAAP
jgi:hypothetical protein